MRFLYLCRCCEIKYLFVQKAEHETVPVLTAAKRDRDFCFYIE